MKILKHTARALALLAIVPLAVSAQQKLEPGKWTGTVTPPNEGTVAVTYDVSLKGDTIAITLNAAEHGSFPLQEVKLADGKLTFFFTPGPRVDCALEKKEDGSFAGRCGDGGGESAEMIMMPPKKGF